MNKLREILKELIYAQTGDITGTTALEQLSLDQAEKAIRKWAIEKLPKEKEITDETKMKYILKNGSYNQAITQAEKNLKGENYD